MGKLQQEYLDKQPPFPADETGIKFQTAQQAMDDPNLKFKPEAQYANVAEGGRIGYREGQGVESIPVDQMQDIEGQMAGGEYNRAMELMLKLKENIPLTDEEKEELKGLMQTLLLTKGRAPRPVIDPYGTPAGETPVPAAQGGRIGYNRGRVVNPGGYAGELAPPHDDTSDGYLAAPPDYSTEETFRIQMRENLLQKLAEENPDATTKELYKMMEEQYGMPRYLSQGGRIGAQEGGLMNLGGMEKDYRQEGGFVPIGGR